MIELTAKTKPATPAQRVTKIRKANVKLKERITQNAKSMQAISTSPRQSGLKGLRIKKFRALQTFLQSAIILNNARIKEILSK